MVSGVLVSRRKTGFGIYYENGFDYLRKRLISQAFSVIFMDMEHPTAGFVYSNSSFIYSESTYADSL